MNHQRIINFVEALGGLELLMEAITKAAENVDALESAKADLAEAKTMLDEANTAAEAKDATISTLTEDLDVAKATIDSKVKSRRSANMFVEANNAAANGEVLPRGDKSLAASLIGG